MALPEAAANPARFLKGPCAAAGYGSRSPAIAGDPAGPDPAAGRPLDRSPNAMKTNLSLPALALLAAVPLLPLRAASLTPLGDLPGGDFHSAALAVSADGGTVVGVSISANGFVAFRWQGGTMTGLSDLPGGSFFSAAYGVSADGSTIAGYGSSANGPEAFRWQGGTMTGLGDLPGGDFGSYAYDVSADGSTVVGFSISANGSEAFRWPGGTANGLGGSPVRA